MNNSISIRKVIKPFNKKIYIEGDKSISIRKLGSEKQETIKFTKALQNIKSLNKLPIQ